MIQTEKFIIEDDDENYVHVKSKTKNEGIYVHKSLFDKFLESVEEDEEVE